MSLCWVVFEVRSGVVRVLPVCCSDIGLVINQDMVSRLGSGEVFLLTCFAWGFIGRLGCAAVLVGDFCGVARDRIPVHICLNWLLEILGTTLVLS